MHRRSVLHHQIKATEAQPVHKEMEGRGKAYRSPYSNTPAIPPRQEN